MTDIPDDSCSFLPFLPPFVRAEGMPSGDFLDRFLRIFEAMLIGRADGPQFTSLRDGQLRVDQSFEKIIDQLPELFDPWWTPARFLPFLAARLGLVLDDADTDYRKRSLIAMAVGIYQQRWTKGGLYRFLDLYASTAARPRVAVDDGESLFSGYLKNEGGLVTANLCPLAFARPGPPELPQRPASATTDPVRQELRQALENRNGAALTHPVAIAVGQVQGLSGTTVEYVVADSGPRDLPSSGTRAALWRLSQSGQFLDWTSDVQAVPRSLNANDPDANVQDPVAIVAEGNGSYLVLDRKSMEVYRYTLAGRVKDPVVTKSQLNALTPVGMVLDTQGGLLVLGKTPSLVLRVAITTPGSTPDQFPLAPTIDTPTALCLEPAGTVLIAGSGDKQQNVPGNLFRLTLASKKVEPLLAPQNSLIFPSSLVLCPDGSVLVCDRGFKDDTAATPLVRVVAEPARLFRVDLNSASRAIEVRLNTPLVEPVHLAWDDQRLLVLDKGSSRNGTEWRTKPHQFGVCVKFSATRPTAPSERFQFFLTLTDILNRERPAHAIWNYEADPSGISLAPSDVAPNVAAPSGEAGVEEAQNA